MLVLEHRKETLNMTDTETKFDPEWKHGWDILRTLTANFFPRGVRHERCENVRLLATDIAGEYPIAVVDSTGCIFQFKADGAGAGAIWRLVNRPAPKASGTEWMVVRGTAETVTISYYNGEGAEKRAREAAASFLRRGCRVLAIKSIDWTEGEGL